MTIDDAIDLVDMVLRLRREVSGLAQSVDVKSGTFLTEWRVALVELSDRLDHLAHLEAILDPILQTPSTPWTVAQYRVWLVQQAHPQDEDDGTPAPLLTVHVPPAARVH